MAVALPDGFAGQGDIDGLHFELLLGHGGLERGTAGNQLFLDGGADLIGHLAHDRALLRGELAHRLEDGGQLAFFAQELYPRFLQRGQILGILQPFQRTSADGFQCGFHSDPSILIIIAFWRADKKRPRPATGTKPQMLRGTTQLCAHGDAHFTAW